MPNHSLNDTDIGSISVFLQSKDSAQNFRPGENSQCKWYLQNIVSPPPDTMMMIGLTSAEIPFTFYNVPANHNFIKLNANYSDGSNASLAVTVPAGNYNVFSLRDAINDGFTSLTGVSMTFDEITNKYTIKNSLSGGTVQIVDTTMKHILGYEENQILSNSANLVAQNCCNLAGTSSIYVNLYNMSFTNLDSRGDLNGVVAKLPVTAAPGEYIFYEQTENQYFVLQDREIQTFEVALTDDNNDPVNLNGLHFSVTLTLHFAKRRLPDQRDQFYKDKPMYAYLKFQKKKKLPN